MKYLPEKTTREKIIDYHKEYDTDVIWKEVKNIIKNEEFYLMIFSNKLLSRDEDGFNLFLKKNEVFIDIGPMPINGDYGIAEKALLNIKTSFLVYLEKKKIIKHLKIENQLVLNTEDRDELPYNVSANFIVNNPKDFKREVKKVEKEYRNKNKLEKLKKGDLPILENGYIRWENKRIPFQGIEGSVMGYFLENAKIIKNDFVIDKGTPLVKIDICRYSNLKHTSFNETLKSIRAKIKENKLPLFIDNVAKCLFLMVINVKK